MKIEKLKKILLLNCALLIPLLSFIVLIIFKEYQIHSYKRVIVPITAYDPRSFLSGNYLTYQLTDSSYTSPIRCPVTSLKMRYACWSQTQPGKWQINLYEKPPLLNDTTCHFYRTGDCSQGYFNTQSNHYYIPEQYSHLLEKALKNNQVKIELVVTPENELIPIRLYIDNKPGKF